jgi:hypothetical protein
VFLYKLILYLASIIRARIQMVRQINDTDIESEDNI